MIAIFYVYKNIWISVLIVYFSLTSRRLWYLQRDLSRRYTIFLVEIRKKVFSLSLSHFLQCLTIIFFLSIFGLLSTYKEQCPNTPFSFYAKTVVFSAQLATCTNSISLPVKKKQNSKSKTVGFYTKQSQNKREKEEYWLGFERVMATTITFSATHHHLPSGWKGNKRVYFAAFQSSFPVRFTGQGESPCLLFNFFHAVFLLLSTPLENFELFSYSILVESDILLFFF